MKMSVVGTATVLGGGGVTYCLILVLQCEATKSLTCIYVFLCVNLIR